MLPLKSIVCDSKGRIKKLKKKRRHLSAEIIRKSTKNKLTHKRFNTTDNCTTKSQNQILKMLQTEVSHKETLSPFNPLPAIGQKVSLNWEDRQTSTEIIEGLLKNIQNIKLDELDKRKVSPPSLSADSIKIKFFNGKDRYEESNVDLLKEIKINRAKGLMIDKTNNILDPVVLNSNKKHSDEFSKTRIDDAVNKFINKLSKNSARFKERRADGFNGGSVKNVGDKVTKNTCEKVALSDQDMKRSELFTKPKKLLDRRRRESFSDVLPVDELMLSQDERIRAKKEFQNLKNFDDSSRFSSSDSDSSLPKMSSLIEMYNSNNNANNSRRNRERARRANKWF